MKYKKSLIFALLIICLFSIAGVCASDVGGGAESSNIQSTNDTLDSVVTTEETSFNEDTDVIASNEDDSSDAVSSEESNQDKLSWGNEHSFEELQNIINQAGAGEEITLDYDYSLFAGGDTLVINKPLTINGNNHVLDGVGLKRILTVNDWDDNGLENITPGIVLKNIKFLNGGACDNYNHYSNEEGGAIYSGGGYNHLTGRFNELTLINCAFENNGASSKGGAISWWGDLTIIDSEFSDNTVDKGNGGAVYLPVGKVTVNNTRFENNNVKDGYIIADFYSDLLASLNAVETGKEFWIAMLYFHGGLGNTKGVPSTGGAIFSNGDVNVENSYFSGNKVGEANQVGTAGGAIHSTQKVDVRNSTFISNRAYDEFGGAIIAEDDCHIYDSIFKDNVANCGGAVASFGRLSVYNSEFSNNYHEAGTTWTESLSIDYFLGLIPGIGDALDFASYTLGIAGIDLDFLCVSSQSKGGAVYSDGVCHIESCNFNNNHITEYGGAVYANHRAEVIDSKFTSNNVFRGENHFSEALQYQGKNRDAGAIHCEGSLNIIHSSFNRNSAPYEGGAVYVENECNVYNSTFSYNTASVCGGAISAQNVGKIFNTSFTSNQVTDKLSSDGGAIYIKKNCNPNIENCQFVRNNALKDGGAIFVDSEGATLTVSGSRFDSNAADIDGGAFYCRGYTNIYSSRFENNKAAGGNALARSYGGAVNSKNNIYVENSVFNNNKAYKSSFGAARGGAIYTDSRLKIEGSTFTGNTAEGYGGAVYANIINEEISNSVFRQNRATDGDGGAIYIESETYPKVRFSTFEDNTAKGRGGAIYTEHGGSAVSMVGSSFIRNSAKEGGAAYIIKGTEIHDCIFKQNKATDGDGGAIYMDDECYPSVVGCTFQENTATGLGGAIYTDHGGSQAGVVRSNFIRNSAKEGGALYVSKIYSNTPLQYCTFRGNRATSGDGGAIYIDNECYPKVWDSTFEENTATGLGGAIYTDHGGSQVSFLGSSFVGNSAKEGGAAYVSKATEIDSCTFRGNRATSGDGGAIYIDNEAFPKVRSSTFEVNTASGRGGGIYTDHGGSQVSIVGSTFTGNSAQQGGGAAFISKGTEIENSRFKGNTAPHGHGGALFINCACTPYVFGGTVFEFNSAAGRGGGMYLESSNAVLRIGTSENSRVEAIFEGNAAAQGGGVYTGQIADVVCSAFLGNRATAAEDGDGGGIYVNSKCAFSLHWSRFEDNLANNRGGAVYTQTEGTAIEVMKHCTFVHNHAYQRNYYGTSAYRGPGHDIFNSGHFHWLQTCWYGSNSPDFNSGRLIEYHALVDDSIITPGKEGITKLEFWHSCYETHGSDSAYVGNYYGVALVFRVWNSETHVYDEYYKNSWDPFYHSAVKYYGDKITVKYGNRNLRVSYAQFALGKTGYNELYIQLDDQWFYLPLQGWAKNQPTVRIDSCQDVKYPNALKVTYTISPKSASSYVIKDSQGEIVKTGSLDPNQNTAYVEGLTPGSYSITISNSETSSYSAGSATKTFNIAKGDLGELRVVVYNKTYPEDVGCIVYASVDGEYNLTVGNATSAVTVTNGVGYINIGTLENGTYEAVVNFTENGLYVSCSNSTTFVVYSQGNGTYFAVDINATEIDYGQTALVTHVLSEIATGNITYRLSDGTFLGELPVNETLTLPILEPGYYVIIANYTGDENYNSSIDSVGLMVNRLDSGFTSSVVDENGTVIYYIQYDQIPIVANLLDGNATGTIRYLFNGTLLGETQVCERYNLSKLNPGFYNITAEYSGDGHFNNASANFILYVTKSSSFTISINSSDSIPYGQNITVTHELPYDANGSIMYYLLDGESAEGEGIFLGELPVNETLTLPILDTGVYSIFAVYSGDNNYDKCTSIQEFVITAASIEFSLNITAKKFIYGETPTVSPILPPVGGNVSYYLSDGTFLGESSVVENFTLPVLNGGTHIIIGKYSGDRNHLTATANITLIVFRAQPSFEVGVNESEIIYGSTTFVTFALPANATGSISYYLSDGTFLGELPINETLNLPILNAGSHVIICKYSGDINYLNTIENAILTVNKEQTEIFADMLDTTYGNDDYLVITVKDIKGNTIAGIDVAVDLNGVKNYTTDENGQIKVSTSGLDGGIYDAAIIFDGTGNYLNSSNVATVVINRLPTAILADMLNTTHWSKEDLLITLKDIHGNPIVGVNMTVDLNGVKNYTTDENGQIKVSTYDLDVGTHDVAIKFDGTRNYMNSSNVAIVIINKTPAEIVVDRLLDIIESQKAQINALSKSSGNTNKVVSKKATKITATKKTFKVKTKAKKYTITLKSDKKAVSKVKVTIKVGKKTYTAKTNNKGKATFKLKKLTKKGKYTAVIKFKGNKNYKATSKKVKIVLK